MKIIGLTGSMGMGKSVAAALLRRLRIPVFDSDACVHYLLRFKATEAVLNAFPDARDKETATINRQQLAKTIFADPNARRKLESILHPLVWEEQRKFIAKARRMGRKKVVLDIPLLFETGRDKYVDAVLCVTAPAFLQRQRLLRRPHMNEEKIKTILSQQIPDPEKRRRSDYVIPTGLGRGFTLQKLKKSLRSLVS